MVDGNITILAIGAATQDVFLIGKALAAKRDVRSHNTVEQFPLGSKADIDQVVFDTGGGATNAAVTFARQGLEVGYVGKVGYDPAGAEVLRVLKREGVSTDRVATDPKLGTGYSTLLVAPNGERVILSYRGASHHLTDKDIAIRTLTADWMYISSLAGNLKLLEKLLKHANTHGIRVALNPGSAELAQGKKLRALLPLVTILTSNAEELVSLFGGNLRAAAEQASTMCQYVVVTDGGAGVMAVHNGVVYQAGQYQKVKVLDRTGAGDAFGSGFTTAIAKGMSIHDAITLGSANATSVVQHVGAKPGILKTSRLKRMKIRESAL